MLNIIMMYREIYANKKFKLTQNTMRFCGSRFTSFFHKIALCFGQLNLALAEKWRDQMSKSNSAKNRYHFAKLSLFNIRLMSELQNCGSPISNVIDRVAKQNGMNETPSLLHQGAFLQFAYTCLIWLWESAKREKFDEELMKIFPEVATRLKLNLSCKDKIQGERPVNDWKAVVRLVRNALGHGRVEVTETEFIFSDKNTFNNKEQAPTTLKLSWEEVGKLSETVIHSVSPILWPDTATK